MTAIQILAWSYLALGIGIALVTLDLRAQGLRTIAAVKSHWHTFRIVTVLGASATLLGVMGATLASTWAFSGHPEILLAALPALAAFFWAAKAIDVA